MGRREKESRSESKSRAARSMLPLLLPLLLAWLMCALATVATSSAEPQASAPAWAQAGWSEEEAAAHVLDRLAFGARPGEVERVAAMGVDRWLDQQLGDELAEPLLEDKLAQLDMLDLETQEIAETYASRGTILRRAVAAGVIEDPRTAGNESMDGSTDQASERPSDRPRLGPEERRKLRAWAEEQGIRPQHRAMEELVAQKLWRARYAENQLREVLTDFWFNHFNVSITDNQARVYVWAYERDAIRPFVLGDFGDMLEATARHPAMLHYLDNTRSVASGEQKTTLDGRLEAFGRRGERIKQRLERRRQQRPNRASGLNENYARELMELHTLGVDGGYDQQDVIEVARAFTGWTAIPPEGLRPGTERELRRMASRPEAGFVVDQGGGFLFRSDAHDAGAKTVLGHRLAAGRGIEDGLDVLELLAAHPSTARHLASKLAIRFIADQPSAQLVERLAAVFTGTGGDLLQVMRALVESPEFWHRGNRGAKIKSPFELAASALRACGAELKDPRPLAQWVERMGQPLYAYQAPTGYPDRAEAWVNTGALLNRMNFGLQLATGRIAGIQLDLPELNGGREPESLDQALRIYTPVLLPGRDTAKTLELLGPMVRDPELAQKVEASAPAASSSTASSSTPDDGWQLSADRRPRRDRERRRGVAQPEAGPVDSSPLAHVVGVIFGSPEFQRR